MIKYLKSYAETQSKHKTTMPFRYIQWWKALAFLESYYKH